ncbi:hypothetical protein NQ318_000870 [Aromia moschata]|uniref:DUF4817 domain-containing protein n=1 Tax=Aromia moschata TaxID=1265417 RepID=A0AAV8ZFX4_9CUCU|nr:hypothetical protein NQ318_000870 [Aromia moschata]
MDRFTLEQRWEILKNYFQSECCVAETVSKLRTIFGRNEAPSAPGVRKFLRKVRETGMLMDKRSHPRLAPRVRTAERVAAVTQSVRENPRTSTRHRAQQLNVSRTSLRRILHKDLGLFAYKLQLTQEVKENDHPLRYRFSVWVLNEFENDNADFNRKIIFWTRLPRGFFRELLGLRGSLLKKQNALYTLYTLYVYTLYTLYTRYIPPKIRISEDLGQILATPKCSEGLNKLEVIREMCSIRKDTKRGVPRTFIARYTYAFKGEIKL